MSLDVFLAEDHQILIEGFRSALAKHDINIIDVSMNLDELSERFDRSHANTLVINARLLSKSKNGIETSFNACQELLKDHPEVRIVMYSHFDEIHNIEHAYKIGAKAFFLTSERLEIMCEAIRTASAGTNYVSPQTAQALAESSLFYPSPALLLNEKELKVFRLLADGVLQYEIANQMGFTRKTISEMVKNIKEKLGLDNVADFTKLAIRYGMANTGARPLH